MDHAIAKGLCADNPAACTIEKKENKERRRHSIEGLKTVRNASPDWLKNAIDLALITAQRRHEISNMKFEDIKDGYLYVVQQKTEKSSDAGWIRFELTPQLKEVISRCRDNIASPYIIHRKPLSRRPSKDKKHWTHVREDYITKEFTKIVDSSGAYDHLTKEQRLTFHEIRALSTHLYKAEGKDAQKIAGHASEDMTKNYQKNHEQFIWSDATPDLDISKIIQGQF